ncbi:MAG: hypothetical protein BWX80_04141 [Candidatus Hydrogenedentes bacterium ADurb.Bin101]|nr:MAG: hypothetical protein BWX80_04141 [Candidatus Hydrogenedentes bacterium ADurb.Bin101]
MSRFLEVHGQFARTRRFALALQAHQHNNSWRLLRTGQGSVFLTHNLDQFVVHNLDDLLAGVNTGKHFLTDGRFLNIGDKLLYHLNVDIRLQQRDAYLLQRLAHIRFGQAALAANGLEDGFKAFSQVIKHSSKRPFPAVITLIGEKHVTRRLSKLASYHLRSCEILSGTGHRTMVPTNDTPK